MERIKPEHSTIIPQPTDDYSALGMDSIENQIFSILTSADWDISPLLADSLVPMQKLYDHFILDGNSYASFTHVKEVHEWLRAKGLITIEKRRSYFSSETLNEDTFCLIKLSPEEIKTMFWNQPSRDENYILAAEDENGIRLINDLPPKRIYVPHSFCMVRKFDMLLVKINCHPLESDLLKLRKSLYIKAQELLSKKIFTYHRLSDWQDMRMQIQFRDMIGMCKILLERLNICLGRKVKIPLQGWIDEMANNYMLINNRINRKEPIEPLVPNVLNIMDIALRDAAEYAVKTLEVRGEILPFKANSDFRSKYRY